MTKPFYEAWDERRAPAVARPARPVQPVPAGTATPYALAALDGELANIQAVPVGSGRNDQLNRSAVKMYGLVAAGHIDERTVTETLGAADGGIDYPATRRTLQSARDAVFTKLGARVVPESTGGTSSTQQTTTDPFGEGVYVGAVSSGTAGDAADTTEPNGSASKSAPATVAAVTPSTGSGPSSSADAAYQARVTLEADTVRLRRDARRLVDHEDATAQFREPPHTANLTAELAESDNPATFRVADLFPVGANVLLTAQYKTGKTTLVNNLARALADGEPFLDRYAIDPPRGRIALFNYEVSRDQYRRWLRDVGINNTDRVAVLPLRGFRLPLNVPHVEQWVVDYLLRVEASVWIVDPFARASVGIDENSNSEVGVWLDTLDVIKERAGIDELVLPTHTGRGEMEQGAERARGATRLDDWADVRWLLTRDGDTRYLRATGRDVEVDEAALAYDEQSRHLSVVGGNRGERNRASTLADIIGAVQICEHDQVAPTQRTVRDMARARGAKFRNDDFPALCRELVNRGDLRIESGPSRSVIYRLARDPDPFDK